ncbi:MAG: phosphodiesterase [Rhodococcus sp. (in: high G+C Gram-positive bacteria)]|uniref:phosphodiesterase n=1 Tax=Rhodococcus sp. TaxID=1831 RepID=UPI002ADAD142|nr:phosphodiesterase [Rhodococcus sp. (in: high G+C Gram-positive bacteria)]
MIDAVMGVPFRALSAVRGARAFHPDGVSYNAELVRLVPDDSALPLYPCVVSVRVSKGIGVPAGLPDVAGVAIRLPPAVLGGVPWDIVLAGSATGRFGRMVPWPSASWNAAHLSSLMPLKYEGRLWWLRARITAPTFGGMRIDDVAHALEHDRVNILIEHAGGTGVFEPLATVHSMHPTSPVLEIAAFDPIRNCPPVVRPQPEWLRALRLSAYRNSRTGRSAAESR